MLQIKNISKKYQTGDLIQTALDGVSLNLRDNEFVAILGPSGSGKTTLLNIIGGLDRYDSGDLIINAISTKKYKDRDWDSYRNHTIGFVFQSYNLIPHQSILSNVELALTISGISRKERKNRAKKALEEVGLGEQIHKKPNQMSGGQMQRVAIARALVNNPDILLADEPTGALDTETSVQVMELLKEVAKNRLVVMVTHNPELAEEYATRTVRLRDGRVVDDTDPYEVDADSLKEAEHKNMGKASMSFMTSLSLSFNNLKTKKGRTILTAFAGSIGIIGIALILSLSTGVNQYIEDIQKSTMASYPITIEERTFDLSTVIAETPAPGFAEEEADHALDGVYVNGSDLEQASKVQTNYNENNLTEFKKYLDKEDSEIHEYVGENGIIYSYNTNFSIFTRDSEEALVNTDGSTLEDKEESTGRPGGGMFGGNLMGGSAGNFSELLPGVNGEGISTAITDTYDVVAGDWPKEFNEMVLALDKNSEISATKLYEIGVLPISEYKEIMDQMENGEEVIIENRKIDYEEIMNQPFYLLPAVDTFVKEENGQYRQQTTTEELENLLENAVEMKVSGIIRLKKEAEYAFVSGVFGYTQALTDYLIDYTNGSEIVKEQEASKEINVLTGVSFAPADEEAKIEDAKKYLATLGVTEKANLFRTILASGQGSTPGDGNGMPGAGAPGQSGEMGEVELAAMFDSYLQDPEDETILAIYESYISPGSYEENMEKFGVVSLDAPSAINIYADSFDAKDKISEAIENYNGTVAEENKIVYTDYVAILMSSVTTIINVITYVLIAFVAVSLVVSSIMIGIITYISVLERTKEIGILRAIGASKKNISQVFNAETFIIGIITGFIGVGVTLLLLIPGNAVIHAMTGLDTVNAVLPPVSGMVLIVLSILLTVLSGLLPAKKAAKQDPVVALRRE
ncbi:ABC transporter ATP-binding protein/permease [Proteiniclasticum ruminis]|uniref:ABC transporter ATP-binding protein/permease n=1 Tax=Proteiniclasticum ruminis TaxID=398199 RepID=UPI002899E145|nr:ABC transporter ATP-binding protein/permease [Proteiniclasticum ruminis]